MNPPFKILPLFSMKMEAGKPQEANSSVGEGFAEKFGRQVFLPNLKMRFRTGGYAEMEKQAIGLNGSFLEPHTGFMQDLTAFFQVAGFTGDHDISPVGFSAKGFGPDMIHRKDIVGISTILAGEIIASQDILFTEGNALLPFPPHHIQHPDYGRKRIRH